MFGRLDDALDTIETHAASLPSGCGELVGLAEELVKRRNRIAALERRVAARAAAGSGWKGKGHRNAEDWVADTTGTSKGKAKQSLVTEDKLTDLPVVDDAVSAGKLSPEQTDLVAKAAAVAPDRQSELVEAAGRESLAGLRKRCNRIIREHDPDPDATHQRVHRNRNLQTGIRDDGTAYLNWEGTADVLADMHAHLAAETDRIFNLNRRNGTANPSVPTKPTPSPTSSPEPPHPRTRTPRPARRPTVTAMRPAGSTPPDPPPGAPTAADPTRTPPDTPQGE